MMSNKIATKVSFETSVNGHEIRGLAWRESLCSWGYAHLMPRRELVSRTPKTAAEVVFGRLLAVTSLNRVFNIPRYYGTIYRPLSSVSIGVYGAVTTQQERYISNPICHTFTSSHAMLYQHFFFTYIVDGR